jgi:hypothetical protein
VLPHETMFLNDGSVASPECSLREIGRFGLFVDLWGAAQRSRQAKRSEAAPHKSTASAYGAGSAVAASVIDDPVNTSARACGLCPDRPRLCADTRSRAGLSSPARRPIEDPVLGRQRDYHELQAHGHRQLCLAQARGRRHGVDEAAVRGAVCRSRLAPHRSAKDVPSACGRVTRLLL